MSRHLYVDETKERGYQLVAVGIETPGQLEDLRKLMRGLVLHGQHRVHMKKEDDSRKRAIAAAICGAGVQAVVYDTARRYPHELDARAACLRALVEDNSVATTLLVLERDDSLFRWDLQRLIELTRETGCRDSLRYEHRRAAVEPLLAVPDAIAWCWAKGGDWRRRIHPAVRAIRSV